MLIRLYDEERCMGMPETLPHHKTTKRTRKGKRTKQNTNYWVEEATRSFIIRLKSRSRYYNGRDSSKTQARTRVGGQKKDERILWDGGGRDSQVVNTELVSARASEDEDDECRERQASSVDHRARALEHQEDEHHELTSTWATTNTRAHGHVNTNAKNTNTKKTST